MTAHRSSSGPVNPPSGRLNHRRTVSAEGPDERPADETLPWQSGLVCSLVGAAAAGRTGLPYAVFVLAGDQSARRPVVRGQWSMVLCSWSAGAVSAVRVADVTADTFRLRPSWPWSAVSGGRRAGTAETARSPIAPPADPREMSTARGHASSRPDRGFPVQSGRYRRLFNRHFPCIYKLAARPVSTDSD